MDLQVLESYMIPECEHMLTAANEGFFTDDKKLGAKTGTNGMFDNYGNKNGVFTYPNAKFIEYVSENWSRTQADFNKGGVAFFKKLTDAIVSGVKFADTNTEKYKELYDAGKTEECEKLHAEFRKIFADFIAINQNYNRGNKPFTGIPEPVKDTVKTAVLNQVKLVSAAMKKSGEFTKDKSVANIESKATIKKIFHSKKINGANANTGYFYLEVYRYGSDWLDYLYDVFFKS